MGWRSGPNLYFEAAIPPGKTFCFTGDGWREFEATTNGVNYPQAPNRPDGSATYFTPSNLKGQQKFDLMVQCSGPGVNFLYVDMVPGALAATTFKSFPAPTSKKVPGEIFDRSYGLCAENTSTESEATTAMQLFLAVRECTAEPEPDDAQSRVEGAQPLKCSVEPPPPPGPGVPGGGSTPPKPVCDANAACPEVDVPACKLTRPVKASGYRDCTRTDPCGPPRDGVNYCTRAEGVCGSSPGGGTCTTASDCPPNSDCLPSGPGQASPYTCKVKTGCSLPACWLPSERGTLIAPCR